MQVFSRCIVVSISPVTTSPPPPAHRLASHWLSGSMSARGSLRAPARTLRWRSVILSARAATPIREGTVALGLGADPSLPAEDHRNLDPYRIATEPYYQPLGSEIEIFSSAYSERLPVMLKGPTGCGKTRFVEHMAWRLSKPLITAAAHEDMTAADLAGRYLLEPFGTLWHDAPFTIPVPLAPISLF